VDPKVQMGETSENVDRVNSGGKPSGEIVPFGEIASPSLSSVRAAAGRAMVNEERKKKRRERSAQHGAIFVVLRLVDVGPVA
jgi:hypothetical protein